MKNEWEKDLEEEASRYDTAGRGMFEAGARWMREYLRKMIAKGGGDARARALSPERRSQIAKKAAAARDAKRPKKT